MFQVLPLQLASLLLVTLPWTLPRLLDLQAANPVAVLDGTHLLVQVAGPLITRVRVGSLFCGNTCHSATVQKLYLMFMLNLRMLDFS